MLRKLQGRVVCLAPAGEHGAADSLGTAFANAGLVTTAEQKASEALAEEESAQASAGSEKPTEPTNSAAQEPESDGSTNTADSQTDLKAELDLANAKLLEMGGQISLLTSMNATLNKEKADMQSALDKASAQATASEEAAASLSPLAKRQILVLAKSLNEGVDREALDSMSATEIASKGASLLARFNKALPDHQVSQTPADQTNNPTKTDSVPNAHEAGLGNL